MGKASFTTRDGQVFSGECSGFCITDPDGSTVLISLDRPGTLADPARLLEEPPRWPYQPQDFTYAELMALLDLPEGLALPASSHPESPEILVDLAQRFPELVPSVPCPDWNGKTDLYVTTSAHVERMRLLWEIETRPEADERNEAVAEFLAYLETVNWWSDEPASLEEVPA